MHGLYPKANHNAVFCLFANLVKDITFMTPRILLSLEDCFEFLYGTESKYNIVDRTKNISQFSYNDSPHNFT